MLVLCKHVKISERWFRLDVLTLFLITTTHWCHCIQATDLEMKTSHWSDLISSNQVERFLVSTAAPESCADVQGRRLATELLLALAAQRGALRHVLSWVELALRGSTGAGVGGSGAGGSGAEALGWEEERNGERERVARAKSKTPDSTSQRFPKDVSG